MTRRLVVVAHPDDEVLWFGALCREVEAVVVAFQASTEDADLGARRARLMQTLPYPVLNLGLDEPGSFGLADWAHPRRTEAGLALSEPARTRYDEGFRTLRQLLKPVLRGPGALQVFTHNPWGEYGHEDHVLVHRAVTSVIADAGEETVGGAVREVFVPTVSSVRSARLAGDYRLGRATRELAFGNDAEWCRRVKMRYQEADCWTWHDDWRAPVQLRFLSRLELNSGGAGAALQEIVDAA